MAPEDDRSGMTSPPAICPRCREEGLYALGWFSCTACGFETDLTGFKQEVAQQTAAFFEALPGFAPGSSEPQLRGLADTLLRAGIRPALTWTLVVLWNETLARPPMQTAMLRDLVDDVAARVLRNAA